MKFIKVEKALEHVSGNQGKFQNTAGSIEQILSKSTTPEEKAEELAKLIRECGDRHSTDS